MNAKTQPNRHADQLQREGEDHHQKDAAWDKQCTKVAKHVESKSKKEGKSCVKPA